MKFKNYDKALNQIRPLNSKKAFSILSTILKKGESTNRDLCIAEKTFNVSNVSQPCKEMVKAGILSIRTVNKITHYRPNEDQIFKIINAINKFSDVTK